MLGQIGAPRAANTDRLNTAADIALTWTGGWQEGDKKAIRKEVDVLKAVIAENQAIYDQAAAALKDLSAREKAHAAALAEFQEQQREWDEATRGVSQRLAEQETALDDKRRSTETELKQREDAADLRERDVAEREKAARKAVKEAEAKAAAADKAVQEATEARQAADKARADYENRVAQTQAVWARQAGGGVI